MDIDPDFKEFIELLNKYQVEYLVVGGYAVAMYGYPRYTGDIDFWIKPNKENATKIVNALVDFGFGSYDISEDDFIKTDGIIQLGFPPNRINLLTGVTGLNFEICYNERNKLTLAEIEVNFISLFHLRLNKKETGREKDLNDLSNLPDN
jgi:hypothetical protein